MIKTLALVLKKQDIGETDRIITVFTPDLGKKRVIAKAVRRPLSKIAGHLDTFMLSQLILSDGDLPRVTSAVLAEPFEEIRNSLTHTKRAFAISRLVERVILEDVSQRRIFQLTLDALVRLNDGRSWNAVWLYFLHELSEELGLGANSFTCLHCEKKITESCFWNPDERRLVCGSCLKEAIGGAYLEENSIKLLQLLRRQPFLAVEKIKIPNINAAQAEELFLREITQWFNKSWKDYSSL